MQKLEPIPTYANCARCRKPKELKGSLEQQTSQISIGSRARFGQAALPKHRQAVPTDKTVTSTKCRIVDDQGPSTIGNKLSLIKQSKVVLILLRYFLCHFLLSQKYV